MARLLLGLVKGAALGGAAGYGAYRLGLGASWSWAVYGLIGLIVGLLVGRPVWSHLLDPKSTVWTGILKGLFGFGVGVGLWALATRAIPEPSLALLGGAERPLSEWPFALGGLIGLLYGAWVELDDPPVGRRKQDDAKAPAKK